MRVKFFKAECGDAASIRYFGTDEKFHNIFIDSGYERTFRFVIEKEIKEIINNGEIIDLWVVSHIHDDHIGGIVKYIDTIKTSEYPDVVKQFYYNPPRKYEFDSSTLDASEALSISQGDKLYEYLKSTNKLLGFDIENTLKPLNFYGLSITLLSPSPNQLAALRQKYPLELNNPFEKEEDDSISDSVSSGQDDYNNSIDDFDFKFWKEDSSIENGSSISFIAEHQGTRILWLADSHPSDVLSALRTLGVSETEKLIFDIVKVSHHGSLNNNSAELYSCINCNNYVFSVNGGNKHNLPSKECIAKILRLENRSIGSKYDLYFTYDDAILKGIFEKEEKTIFEKYNFEIHFCREGEICFEFKKE